MANLALLLTKGQDRSRSRFIDRNFSISDRSHVTRMARIKAKYFNLLYIFYLQSFRQKGPPTLMIFSAKGHYAEWEELTCRY